MFRIRDETLVVDGGHVVVCPAGEAHGFTKSGSGAALTMSRRRTIRSSKAPPTW